MEINTNVDYLKSVRCADVYTESSTDYVLPDYLGDVRKILFTEATLRPSGRFAGGDEVEFSGIVVYNVIYLNSEGGLCSVDFTSDYDYSVKCSGENYNDSIADTRVSNYAVRLIGPRKINAKASLVGSVHLCERESLCVSGDAFTGQHEPEINRGTANVRVSKTSSVTEREYAESVAKLDGAIADEVSVIHSFIDVMVEDVHREESTVCVKGKIRMCAVIKNNDEPAYCTEKTIPYEENIDFESIMPDMTLIPQMSVTSLRTEVNAEETGCNVVMSAIVEMCVIGEGNQPVSLVLDGYLKEMPTDNCYESFEFATLTDAVTVRESHSAEISRSEIDSDQLREIVFLTSTPKVESVEPYEGGVAVTGEVRYSGIASEFSGDAISYTGIKFSTPFTINVNLSCQNNEKTQIDVELHTQNASASLDDEKLYVSCSLVCTAVATTEGCQEVLSSMSCTEGECYESDCAKITVYYPNSEDTLFSVAKRFRTSSLKVANDNDITEAVFAQDNPTGSLAGVKKLVIF